jgi:cathepsin L
MNVNGSADATNFLSTPMTAAEKEFISFVTEHRRTYGTKEEYEYRLSLFVQVYEDILAHDAEATGYTKGINQFSDFSAYEWKQMQGYKPAQATSDDDMRSTMIFSEVGLPASVDWRTSAVTGVKNQGSCGSCWAFSTTGSLEGLSFIASGSKTLTSYSEQQLVDCSTSYGNMGCNGGLMDNAFAYAETHEMETEATYPYKGLDGTCAYDASKGSFENTSFTDVATQDPAQLLLAVAAQPVSVAIQANRMVFQSYTSGIITSTNCGTNLDHGVLVVGYGTEGTQDYWIVKNSWGPSWGEAGYVRLGRSTAAGPGICGLQLEPSYPTKQ